MPAKITSLGGGRCKVSTPHGTKAKNTSCGKARKQARLLNAVDHGWKPTGAKAHESARQVLAKIIEAGQGVSGMFKHLRQTRQLHTMRPRSSSTLDTGSEIRPFNDDDWQAYGGAEGTPFIVDVNIDGADGNAIADNNGVQVHLVGPEASYLLPVPFAQGKAMLRQVARARSVQDLKQLGFEPI